MKTTGRYEIRTELGQGGMGVVYRAWDPVMKREVTVKTIRNHQDKTALEMFKREINVLGGMAHPNIVEVYDIGETDETDGRRPYFVMPLLRGTTLDQLIKTAGTRLSAERGVQIIAQACRGIQAAHELGLIHRDIKPSNIFVLEDDSVKVIDFGVAHLMDQDTATGLKGTAKYMAPEQLLMKAPSPLSDQFSIAVVCYELLANRHPFAVGEPDVMQAILKHTPVAICDVNPSVNLLISQVVHKALAKEPVHRFASVRDFSDTLQKALRNEAIPLFDPSKIEPRLERARKALDAGDLDFASEIVRELESESCLHPQIGVLRQTIDTTKRRRQVQQLLETAKKRFDEEEYLLALQKVQESLDLEPENTDAFTLRAAIENKRSLAQVEGSLRLAHQHLDNHAYDLARQSAAKVLQLRPRDPRATSLLAEIERREQESSRVRLEKERVYSLAIDALQHGDVSAALSKLERVLDLERTRPDIASPDQSGTYQKLYEEVKNKHDWLDAQQAEAKRFVSDGNLQAAIAVCDKVLQQYPSHVVFHSLKFDIEESSREQISAYIARVEKAVATEPDLNRKVSILEEARDKYPGEDRFRQSLDRVKERRSLVQGIAGRAAGLENAGQFGEALAQWEILKNTYPQYPGLEIDIERLKVRREQQKLAEAKATWVSQIDRELGMNSFARAEALANDALAEYADDAELAALKRSAELGIKRIEDARNKLDEGLELLAAGKQPEGFAALREASKLDPQSHAARNALMDELLQSARRLLDSDRKAAEPMVAEALELDPNNPLAKSLRTLIQDKTSAEEIGAVRSRARELQQEGEARSAIAELDTALEKYPRNEGLVQLRASLLGGLGEAERNEIRAQDLAKVRGLEARSQEAADSDELRSISAKTQLYTVAYPGDTDFLDPHNRVEQRVQETQTATAAPQAADVPRQAASAGVPWRARIDGFLASSSAFWARLTTVQRAGIGLALAVLAILAIRSGSPSPKEPPPPAPPTMRVALDDPEHEHVLDSKSADVTATLQSPGLIAGSYRLTGDKPGFRNLDQAFEVNVPKGGAPGRGLAPLEVKGNWQPLATVLNIQHGDLDSKYEWSIDGTSVTADQLTNYPVTGSGTHELDLMVTGSRKIQLRFSVDLGYPTDLELKADAGIRAATGVAMALGRGGARLRTLNVPDVRAGQNKQVIDPKADPITWQSTEDVALEAKNGTPLGIVPKHDLSEGGLVFLYLLVREQTKKDRDDTTAPPAQPLILPTINEFRFDPPSVEQDKPATLHWTAKDADTVSINNGTPEAASGSRRVTYSEPRTYTFTIKATNTNGTINGTATLEVRESELNKFCREHPKYLTCEKRAPKK